MLKKNRVLWHKFTLICWEKWKVFLGKMFRLGPVLLHMFPTRIAKQLSGHRRGLDISRVGKLRYLLLPPLGAGTRMFLVNTFFVNQVCYCVTYMVGKK